MLFNLMFCFHPMPFPQTMDDTAKHLYDEKYLICLRCNISAQTVFLRSLCRAEQKKAVLYTVDIKIDKEDGEILQAQCECGAGMGPGAHCKHVTATLYGLSQFQSSGKLNVPESSTSKLQSFHHVKPLPGSPMKASVFNLTHRASTSLSDFDPRPAKYRKMEGYQDAVLSKVINYACQEKERIPLLHMVPPANIPAVCHDHDYLKKTPEEHFLDTIGVNPNCEIEVRNIEQDTRSQRKSTTWLEERRNRLTASNFGISN